jgi:hypothetical protein
MKRLITALVMGSVALGGTAAFAANKESPGANINREAPWQDTHSEYKLGHPMETTCKEFLATEIVYQPFIVGYLEGAAHHKHHGEKFVEAYRPIAVPSVVKECSTAPDKKVWEMIDSMAGAEE